MVLSKAMVTAGDGTVTAPGFCNVLLVDLRPVLSGGEDSTFVFSVARTESLLLQFYARVIFIMIVIIIP